MKHLLVTRPLPERVIAAVRAEYKLEIRDDPRVMSLAGMRAALKDYDAVLPTLGDMFSAEVFAGLENPRCRILANFGVGFNHIDVKAARKAGIIVTNTPGAVTDATADIAMMLILMSARRAGEGERLVRSGQWTGWKPTQMLGLHVTGKTVGIIGMGRIGQAIARRCHYGFDMQVIYTRRSGEAEYGFSAKRVRLEELLMRADIAVLAVPSTLETHHMINSETLGMMNNNAHLINISRGDVVDEAALIRALQAGEIAGAGLDVYEFEPQVPEALIALENVTLLPHLGTAALEVREAMGMMAVENLRAYFAGESLPNQVN